MYDYGQCRGRANPAFFYPEAMIAPAVRAADFRLHDCYDSLFRDRGRQDDPIQDSIRRFANPNAARLGLIPVNLASLPPRVGPDRTKRPGALPVSASAFTGCRGQHGREA
jgi:hypothetical protein